MTGERIPLTEGQLDEPCTVTVEIRGLPRDAVLTQDSGSQRLTYEATCEGGFVVDINGQGFIAVDLMYSGATDLQGYCYGEDPVRPGEPGHAIVGGWPGWLEDEDNDDWERFYSMPLPVKTTEPADAVEETSVAAAVEIVLLDAEGNMCEVRKFTDPDEAGTFASDFVIAHGFDPAGALPGEPGRTQLRGTIEFVPLVDPTDLMDDDELAAHNEAMETDRQYREAMLQERN